VPGERRLLQARVEKPEGTSAAVAFRASRSRRGPWSPWEADPELVPDLPVLQTDFDLTGNGFKTPEVRAGHPRAFTRMVSGTRERATLLKADRSELPGGSSFSDLEEWAARSAGGVRELPDGRVDLQEPFDPVAQLPGSTLNVYTPEARKFVEENWKRERFVLEAWGKAATLKLKAQPEFKRLAGSEVERDGQRWALYACAFPPCEVVREALTP
jgi:hypothetical protein